VNKVLVQNAEALEIINKPVTVFATFVTTKNNHVNANKNYVDPV